jgi:flavodoxin I
LQGVKVAAFDTRMEEEDIDSGFLKFMMNTAGFAAKKILKRLERRGGTAVAEPEGFIVTGEKGPLKDGELVRAASWAKQLFSR